MLRPLSASRYQDLVGNWVNWSGKTQNWSMRSYLMSFDSDIWRLLAGSSSGLWLIRGDCFFNTPRRFNALLTIVKVNIWSSESFGQKNAFCFMPIAFVRSEFNMLAPHSWPRNPKLASFSLNSPIEALAWLRQLKLLTSVENYIVILSCWTHSASHPQKKK